MLFLLFCFLSSDYFLIQKIYVTGNSSVTSQEILSKCDFKVKDNIFSFRSSSNIKNISSIDCVDSVIIHRKYPGVVEVIVEERKSFYSIYHNNMYVKIDRMGIAFDANKILNPTDLIVSGISNFKYKLGEVIDYTEYQRLNVVHNVILQLESDDILNEISEIRISSNGNYYIYTKSSNVIKFSTFEAFENNIGFINAFLLEEDKHIIVQLNEGANPTYKEIIH